MDLLDMAYKLREIHRSIKGLYAERWPDMVTEYEPQLRERAAKQNCTTTAAAIHWAKEPDVDARLSLLLLAVAVEIK